MTSIYSCFILVYLTILQLYISINLSLWQLLIIIYLSLRQLVNFCQSHSLTVFLSPSISVLDSRTSLSISLFDSLLYLSDISWPIYLKAFYFHPFHIRQLFLLVLLTWNWIFCVRVSVEISEGGVDMTRRDAPAQASQLTQFFDVEFTKRNRTIWKRKSLQYELHLSPSYFNAKIIYFYHFHNFSFWKIMLIK